MIERKHHNSFLVERKKFAESIGKTDLYETIDSFPLFCGIKTLARVLSIVEIIKSSLDVPGHIVEFGSWKGSNLMLMAKTLMIHDPLSNKKVLGFEGFFGLDNFNDKDNDAKKFKGKYVGDYEMLMSLIKLFELEEKMSIVKGNILETLPDFLLKNQSCSFSVVYIDTDLYETTSLILNLTHERLSKGGFIVLDEWNFEEWPGESVAVREFLEKHYDRYEMIHNRNSEQPSLILKKI